MMGSKGLNDASKIAILNETLHGQTLGELLPHSFPWELHNCHHCSWEMHGQNHNPGNMQPSFPASWLRSSKFWPTAGRVDNVYGDRNLICTGRAVEEQAAATA
ncbi:hypothetical protein ACFX2J_042681 [Malus domestica]